MEFKDYLQILWRRKWIVVVTTLAAVVSVAVISSIVRPVYQASATLRVAASAGGALNYTASTYSNQLIKTTAQIATSRPLLQQLVTRFGLPATPVVTAEVIPSTELIKITVEDSDPQMAAKIANALVDTLIAQSNELYIGGKLNLQQALATQLTEAEADLKTTREEYDALVAATPPAPEKANMALEILLLKQRNYETLRQQYNEALFQQEIRTNMMTVVEPAVPPRSPTGTSTTYKYLLGLALGLFGGIALAFIIESLDPTLYRIKDIEAIAGWPVLAKIPKSSGPEIRMCTDDTSPLAEAFRNMALSIQMLEPKKSRKTILILGAEPKQGKSTIVHNLAVALAESDKHVVAVDCDMRLPKLHELFNVVNQTGLREILERYDATENQPLNQSKGVSIITSGSQPINPSHLLGTAQLAALIKKLEKQFDYVLLDTPALLAVSDTTAIFENAELMEHVDAFILVVRQSHARRDAVQAAKDLLKAFPDKTTRVVINSSTEQTGSHYYLAGHKSAARLIPETVQAEHD